MNDLIAQLRDRRAAKKMKIKDIAVIANMHAPNISVILAGKQMPELATAQEIGAAMGLELVWVEIPNPPF